MVKLEVKKFFEKRFEKVDKGRPYLHAVNFNTLSQEEYGGFVGPFVESEVEEAIWNCGSPKIPTPDGFNFKLSNNVGML